MSVGQGPPLLLLHGGTGSPESYWSKQVDDLAGSYRLLLVEYPGTGADASPAAAARFSIEGTAAALADMLSESAPGGAHVVGLSMGGAIALQLAADHPSCVARLVLADTLSGIRTERLRRFVDHVLLEALDAGGPDLVYKLNHLFAFSERYLAEHGEELDAGIDAWRSRSNHGHVAAMRAMRAWSIDDRLHEIRAPTLVIWGTEDIEVPLEYSQRLADAIPHAVLTTIPGAGHKTCVEAPRAFNKALRAFLGEDPIRVPPGAAATHDTSSLA